MKTRAFKKVLSVICVLAMLMSVCVVSLVGTTSAATDTYALHINGVVSNQTLEVGAAIPAADSGAPGVVFEGWYDSTDFTKKVDKAGAEKTLYAKFSSTVINFDGAEPGLFDPNNNIQMPVTADPTNSANKAIKYSFSTTRPNVAFETYAGSGVGFQALSKVVGEETVYPKYELSFKYLVTGTPDKATLGIQIYYSAEAGIGANGNKTAGQSANLSLVDVGEWKSGSIIIQNNKKNIDAGQVYPVVTAYYGSSCPATIYFDDIVITEIVEKEYTYHHIDGTVEKQVAAAGDANLPARGAYYQGWYDETLTYKFDKVPANITEFYAKYTKIEYDFEDGKKEIYDPNNKFGVGAGNWSIVADPDNANNKVLTANFDEARYNFALNGAYGAKAGYRLIKGQDYVISFKYKATGVVDETAGNIVLYAATDAGVGVDGNKVSVKTVVSGVKNSADWVEVSVEFNSDVDFATYKNLLVTFRGTTANTGAKLYIDDISIAPKQLPVSTDDFTMDFEDKAGADFKWSVADANNYTVSTGNSYVSRGALVEEADGNVAFAVKHYAAKGKYFYFSIDDGSKLFESINYGLYTINFKYKVAHSETPTAIGIAYVDAETGKFKKAFELASFEYEDQTEWNEITYTFGTDLYDINSYTNFALYVYNSTNVPLINIDTNLETATTVLFDDVVVKTHAEVSEMGMIRFDSVGGDAVEPIIRPSMNPAGTLPEPTKYGFDFVGWQYNTTDAEGNVISHKLDKDTLVPDFVTDAYAVWQVKDGFAQFDFRSNVDEFDAKMPVLVAKPGEPILNFPTEKPEAVGQKFIGWYTDRTFKTMIDPNKAPAESCTLFAKWESTGEVIDFEEYPAGWFKPDGRGSGGPVTDRVSIVTLDDGNHVMYYNFSSGDNQSNTSSIAGGHLAQGDKRFRAVEGLDYTIKFKYKVLEAKASGAIGAVLSKNGSLWGNRQEQTGRMNYGKAEDKWLEGEFTFTATLNAEVTDPDTGNIISIGCSNDCKIYIDDVVLICSFNEMNVYGSAVVFETNGGNDMDVFSGDIGTEMNLPTPVRPGYKFMGWYTDKELTKPLTQKTFGEETLFVYAKWQLGKFIEDFEEFPKTVMSVGVHGAFSLYTKSTAGFDATNVKSGETSLFRNGATAGVKNFTAHRSTDLALTVGETYTLSFYVKPTSVGDVNGTISIMDLKTFTGINQGTIGAVVAKVSDLKQGEWNLVTYTFTATSEFVGLSTTAGNDMYFDDVTVTLKGYTGSANTGDSSVSPILVLMMVIVSAGALIVTGKKVFSK